ncbi:MAG: hypothetical protein OXC57_04980 [Rhodobacteraceae bacterium]|nr:hypothetical protein [Paracoccaceae bacterium]
MYLALEAYQRDKISRGKVLELSKLIEIDDDSLLQHAINTTQVPEDICKYSGIKFV